MYIFAVALQDGRWHHVDSYAPRRAGRADTVRLWHKIETREDPEWERRYLVHRPERAGLRRPGGDRPCRTARTLVDELAVANAHPLGAKPFAREDYISKFRTLTDGIISTREANRFLEVAQELPRLTAGELHAVERRAAGRDVGGRQAGDLLTSSAGMTLPAAASSSLAERTRVRALRTASLTRCSRRPSGHAGADHAASTLQRPRGRTP